MTRKLHAYTVTTEKFGDVGFYAYDMKDARRDARERFGVTNPRAVTRTVTTGPRCGTCDSSPCCCEDG